MIRLYGNWKQRRNRARLQQVKMTICEGPFDILREVVFFLDILTKHCQLANFVIRQRLPRFGFLLDSFHPAAGFATRRDFLFPESLADNLPADGVDHVVVGFNLPGDERFAQAQRCVNHRLAAQPGQRVGAKEHA